MNVAQFKAVAKEIEDFNPERIEVYRFQGGVRHNPLHEHNVDRNELKQKLFILHKGLETRKIFQITQLGERGRTISDKLVVETVTEERRELQA